MSRRHTRQQSRNPALVALVAEGFLSRLAFGVVGFALPLYARSLGMSLLQIGALATVSGMVAAGLKPVMGAAADRFGLKRTMTVAIALRSLLALCYGLATSAWQLYAVRAGHGLADSARDPAVAALLAEGGGERKVASAFAWYQTAKTMAGSLGRGAAGLLITATGGSYGWVFGLAFLLSALPLGVVARMVREPDRGPDMRTSHATAQHAAHHDGRRRRTPAPDVGRFAVLGFLVAGTSGMLGALFPILATEYAGLTAAQAGALYLLTPGLALTGPAFGWLADRSGGRLVLSVRGVSNIASSFLYLALPTWPGYLAGRAFDDLGKAAYQPAWGSVMARVSAADRPRRARIMGVLGMGEDVGDIVAPLAAGLLWSLEGAAAVLLARAALGVVSEVYLWWVTGGSRARTVSKGAAAPGRPGADAKR
ncbi:MAG: MFS transporter [Streptomycetales bacterium]